MEELQATVDYIVNNQASGNIATQLLTQGKFNPGILRPWIGKDGKLSYRETTLEELATMQIQPIEWHYQECSIRITFTDDVKANWLNRYKEFEVLGTFQKSQHYWSTSSKCHQKELR